MKMVDIGKVHLIYLGDDNKKRSLNGKGVDKGNDVEITLNPSKRSTKFNTVLPYWARLVKVNIY